MRHRSKVLAALCSVLLISVTIVGQSTAKLSGPMLGYIFNNSEGRLRPIQGILGNSIVGDAVELGFTISNALVLDGRHFLAATDAGNDALLINMQTAPSVVAVTNAPANFALGAGSRSGSSAALYYADTQRVMIVGGMPLHPRIVQSIDISVFGAPVTQMALSDDGALLIYAITEQERDSLYAWTPASGNRLLTVATQVSGIALARNGDAIVADAGADEVFSIVDPSRLASRRLLLNQADGVSQPTGVTVAPTDLIYVTNRGSSSILTLDSTGRLIRNQQCGCDLSGLYPLRDSVYRLSDRADQTIFLMEAGRADDRVVFVPALHNQ